jgi:hypothetical protein
VPDRIRFGHVNVICVIVLACVGGKRGNWEGQRGWIRGPKMGPLTLSMEQERLEVRSHIASYLYIKYL